MGGNRPNTNLEENKIQLITDAPTTCAPYTSYTPLFTAPKKVVAHTTSDAGPGIKTKPKDSYS